MQFLLSKYVMPAAASRHIETNWRTVKVLELFLKNDNKDPPASGKNNSSITTVYSSSVLLFLIISTQLANIISTSRCGYLPATSSMTIIIGCFCTQIPINFTTLGWSYCFRIRPSCKNFFLCSSGTVTRHVFTATSLLVDRSLAL